MKCTNKIKVFIPLLGICLLLGGCQERTDVAHAYDIYATSDTYQLTESSTEKPISLLGQDLCVGGTQNTAAAEGINTDYAQSAAVFSIQDEEITYAQNIYQRMYPASTTKILTAYLALKYGNLDDVLTVSSDAVNTLMSGSSICGLKPGDQLTLDQALYGLMLCSGNDAANVIAEYISGSTDKFAELMNKEAQALGATSSHFVNPHGLPDDNHYTTAYDLYLIFNECIKHDEFVKIINSSSYTAHITGADGTKRDVKWEPTNYYAKGEATPPDNVTIIGGKTGTTKGAGNCLILLTKDSSGNPYISIIMGAGSKPLLYQDMTSMLSKI